MHFDTNRPSRCRPCYLHIIIHPKLIKVRRLDPTEGGSCLYGLIAKPETWYCSVLNIVHTALGMVRRIHRIPGNCDVNGTLALLGIARQTASFVSWIESNHNLLLTTSETESHNGEEAVFPEMTNTPGLQPQR